MSYRCRGVQGRILGLLVLLVTLPAVAGAQPDREGCKYRDARGNCTATSPFSAKKRRPPQRIIIESEPGDAEVWLDGRKLNGRTPLTLDKPIRRGNYRLRITMQNHVDHEEDITVNTYGRQVFAARLKAWPKVKIAWPEDNGEPLASAELRVDGRPIGGEWWNENISLPPGDKHYVEVEQEGYRSWEKLLANLEPDRTYEFTPQLKKTTGSIVIETNLIELPVYRVPEKACEVIRPEYVVAYDGPGVEFWGRVGPRKLTRPNLSPGAHCVEFRIDGLGAQRRLLSVTANKGAYYRVELSPPDEHERVTLNRLWGEWPKKRAWKQCQAYTSEQPNPSLAEKCLRLGMVLHKDKHDIKRAARAYHSACQAGSAEACEIYGWLSFNGKGDLKKDAKTARTSYKEACRLGLQRACYARHLSDEHKREEPSRYYTLVSNETKSESLLYDSWLNTKISLGLKKFDLPPELGNGTAVLQVDLPLSIFPTKALSITAGKHYAITIGWELGIAGFRLPIIDDEDSPAVIDFNFQPLAEAVLKFKIFPWRSLYIGIEPGFNNFGFDPGVTIAWRPQLVLHWGWDLKVGLEVASLPTVIRGDEPMDTESTLRAFISVGPAMGWLVDKFAGD